MLRCRCPRGLRTPGSRNRGRRGCGSPPQAAKFGVRVGENDFLHSQALRSSSQRGAGGCPGLSPTRAAGDFQAPRGGLGGSGGKLCSKGRQEASGGGRGGRTRRVLQPGDARGWAPPAAAAPKGARRAVGSSSRSSQDVVGGRAAAGAGQAAHGPVTTAAARSRIRPRSPLYPLSPRCLGDGELRGEVSPGLPRGLDAVPHQAPRGLAGATSPRMRPWEPWGCSQLLPKFPPAWIHEQEAQLPPPPEPGGVSSPLLPTGVGFLVHPECVPAHPALSFAACGSENKK